MTQFTVYTTIILIISMLAIFYIPFDPIDYTVLSCVLMTLFIFYIGIKDKDWGEQKNISVFVSYLSVIINLLLVFVSDVSDILGRDLLIIGNVFILFYISIIWSIVSYIKSR